MEGGTTDWQSTRIQQLIGPRLATATSVLQSSGSQRYTTTKVYLYSTQRVKYLISAHFDDNTLKLLKTPNPVSQTSK